ncbi:MAG: hypothetical protein PVH61_39750 [Candidatus Aminicenantes bacterium]|jgi:hypothetical protein
MSRELIVKNIDNAGMPQMVEDIFGHIVEALRAILSHYQGVRHEGWKQYQTYKEEYIKAARPRLFFGLTDSEEINRDANDYALQQMKKFYGGFEGLEERILSYFIRMAKDSPEEFFSALQSVWSGGNYQRSLREPNRGDSNIMNRISQLMNPQEEKGNEGECAKTRRRRFGTLDED